MIEINNAFVQKETWKIQANPDYVSQVVLLNAAGREVYKVANVANGESLDVSAFPPGIYSIKLSNPVEERYLKIVKQ